MKLDSELGRRALEQGTMLGPPTEAEQAEEHPRKEPARKVRGLGPLPERPFQSADSAIIAGLKESPAPFCGCHPFDEKTPGRVPQGHGSPHPAFWAPGVATVTCRTTAWIW